MMFISSLKVKKEFSCERNICKLSHGSHEEDVFSWLDDVWFVDGVLNGAFGVVGDEEVVVREGVVVTSSSLEMLTNSCLGGIMVSLIFLEGLEEEALVEFMVEWFLEDKDEEDVFSWLDDVWFVDGVLNGAFGVVGDEEVVVREGVVVTSSSLEMLTNSCLGGIMVSLIFLEGLEEEALVGIKVEKHDD
uniref:Uncharacterized protein n=1 Tax=Tanacetum cinerariifolium TaxID=118510 RepID=A0A6L2JEA7_TANCI|nr:hypothetical protein [Tanacetum cinerariifolium]